MVAGVSVIMKTFLDPKVCVLHWQGAWSLQGLGLGGSVSILHQIQQIINELLGTEVPSDQVCHIALLHSVQACISVLYPETACMR